MTAPPTPLELKTKRLSLEPLQSRHASLLFETLSDPAIYTFIPFDPPQSVEALAERYARLAVGRSADGKDIWLNFALRKLADDTYLGTVQATITGKRAYVAYELGPQHWGQGYASEAVRAIIAHLFTAYGVEVIRAETDTRNDRSAALLQRLGFVQIEKKENADHFKDSPSHEFVYELTRLAWTDNRLASISEHNGVAYGRVYSLFDAEESHSQSVSKYRGHLALSDAFKNFFLETIELINSTQLLMVKTPLTEFYYLFVPRLTHSFQSLCGAERLAIRGYPYQGYTLLRNVVDNLISTSAVLQKIVDFHSIEGIVPEKPFDPIVSLKLRKKTEIEARKKMTGNQSGLNQQTIDELANWDSLFDYETHGARLSLGHAKGWMQGTELLPVLPKFTVQAFAMFMNRFSEVNWMAHRLVPLVQPPEKLLPDHWQEKWCILDESFEIMVDSLTKQLGKKIGTAIVEFVKVKFPFNGVSQFPL